LPIFGLFFESCKNQQWTGNPIINGDFKSNSWLFAIQNGCISPSDIPRQTKFPIERNSYSGSPFPPRMAPPGLSGLVALALTGEIYLYPAIRVDREGGCEGKPNIPRGIPVLSITSCLNKGRLR
jgi:hypothetical protein